MAIKNFRAKFKKRRLLNRGCPVKKTYEIIFDIEGSDIEFLPGDYLGIKPKNDENLVKKCISALSEEARTEVYYDRFKNHFSLFDLLKNEVNISKFSSKLLKLLLEKADSPKKKERLEKLLQNREETKNYIENHELWDMLEEFYSPTPIKDIVNTLSPMLPRLYSIASSKNFERGELQLIVSYISYKTSNIQRHGVTTHFLCNLLSPGDEVNLYVQGTDHFLLPPKKDVPIIMIASGSGIAPFFSFIQERYFQKIKEKTWLFFGDCHERYDFYKKDFLLKLEREKFLKLDVGFSRDQKEKIYVQHVFSKKTKEVWRWIEDGAVIYVCGSAQKMAKGVEEVLLKMVEKEGKDPIPFLRELRDKKRYLKDVY